MLSTMIMVESPAVAGRPRTPEGDQIRDAILVMLRRVELEYRPKPTFREVGTAIGRTIHPAINHLLSLKRDGMVTWTDGRPRTLTLTDAGGQRADQLIAAHGA